VPMIDVCRLVIVSIRESRLVGYASLIRQAIYRPVSFFPV
jgi:hypothetical protein